MKITCRSLILLTLVILFTSCEKIIDLPLDNSAPMIVIEGKLMNNGGSCLVSISKSLPFDSQAEPDRINDAVVVISSNSQEPDTLSLISEGIYASESINGIQGEIYELKVQAGGKEYYSESKMPAPVKIDTVSFFFSEGSVLSEPGIKAICRFSDPPGIKNYYGINLYRNGKSENTVNMYLYDDVMNDGEIAGYILFKNTLDPGDMITVELICMDKPLYDYFRVLSDLIGQQPGPSAASPANPVSNISNNALGYFGTFSCNTCTLIVPETN